MNAGLGPAPRARGDPAGSGVRRFECAALLFFLFRAFLKKEWLAAAAFVLFLAIPALLTGSWIAWVFAVVLAIPRILVFLRFGLLALVFHSFFYRVLTFAPLTTDSSAWYAGTSLFLLVVLAALAVYGFAIAVGGQPLFAGARLDD